MTILRALCLLLLCRASQSYIEEDYQDYADDRSHQDNMYADYADKQAQKLAGDGGFGMVTTMALCAGSWFAGGKIHSKRAVSKATKKFKENQKTLYMQYYNDIMALQKQNAALQEYVDQMTFTQMEGEFSAADINGDNRVSRVEFNMYKKDYLSKHPEMASQFPRFEDFDPDSDGLISKAEYVEYYGRLMSQ